MNHDQLIKGTNKVALYATIALVYWVFIFLVITAFDLKIFREYMTQVFYLSVLGIFAILGGALILNVMSNLSKISTVLSQERGHASPSTTKPSKPMIAVIVLSFPLICAILFAGNHLSAQKKRNMLISSARSLISENQADLAPLAAYRFSKEYIKRTEKTLGVIKKIDKNLPEVVLIQPDVIDNKKVFLGFRGDTDWDWEYKKPIERATFIYSASREDRAYLDKVFSGDEKNYKFSSRKGHYQLYFPAVINGKKIVFYFSDYQEYGKYGS